MRTSFKDIPPVPTAQEFVDIVLSRTQRQLPTQIRAGFKISRIRAFYTRKVKFAQETLSERLGEIIEAFPRLNGEASRLWGSHGLMRRTTWLSRC